MTEMPEVWKTNLRDRRSGNYQKCSACSWAGVGTWEICEQCPDCGQPLEAWGLCVTGGLLVECVYSQFYFTSRDSTIKIDTADIGDVLRFMNTYWKLIHQR